MHIISVEGNMRADLLKKYLFKMACFPLLIDGAITPHYLKIIRGTEFCYQIIDLGIIRDGISIMALTNGR